MWPPNKATSSATAAAFLTNGTIGDAVSHDLCIAFALAEAPVSRPGISEKLLVLWRSLRKDKPYRARAMASSRPWPDSAIDRCLFDRIATEPLANRGSNPLWNMPIDCNRRAGRIAKLAQERRTREDRRRHTCREKLNRSILTGGDIPAVRMLLACARLGRRPLPLEAADALAASPDAGVARAAEKIHGVRQPAGSADVLARHPGEAMILGAEWGWFMGEATQREQDPEEELRNEVRADPRLEQIFSLLGNSDNITLRFYADHVSIKVQPYATEASHSCGN